MYRLQAIQDALISVVGWEQDYNPTEAIARKLTVSESGLTFQGAHPLCTLNNIRSIMPDDYILRYPVWNNEKEYSKGDKVRKAETVNGKQIMSVWIADHNNVMSEPGTNVDWSHYNMLSDYLEQLTRNGINQAIQRFVAEKQLHNETKSLLEHRTFFDGAARLKAVIDATDKIVGFEIVPVRSMGVTLRINRIGLQMVGGSGEIKLYLFHSSQYAPIKTITVNYTNANGGFQWFNFDGDDAIYLPYMGSNDSGGAWYLCYAQNELPAGMEALNVSKDWSREPCGTCNIGSVENWRELTKYVQVSPFKTARPEEWEENPEMFDVETLCYTNTMNYGINCEITVECDLTDFIVSQRHIFAPVIQKQVAANVLRTLAMNPDVRVNRNQSNASRMDILYELDGNTNGQRPGGLGYDLSKAYKALHLDTQGLDRICLTCNNGGVRYGTI